MADIAVETAIHLLTPLITAEISLISGLPDDVRAIKNELQSISALLKSAEERVVEDEGTKVWVKQVRTLAYDIEDVIEEYQLFQKENAFRKAIDYFLLRVRGMATTIKSISHRTADIGRARDSYRLSNNVAFEQGPSSSQTTTTFTMYVPEQSELVGVEIPRFEILELLGVLDQHVNIIRPSTVAVVGMCGLGKTTIVRCVYNDLTIRGYFPIRAWISMSRTHMRLDILKSMMKQFCEADNENRQLFRKVSLFNNFVAQTNYVDWINSMDQGTLQDLVRKYLEDERYLIVFDDVQDGKVEDMVTHVKYVLPNNNKDSKILVTTRYENVAQAWLDGSSHGAYRLQCLPSEMAWMLFCKKTFQRYEGRCPSQLGNLARGIVQKCEGLPLAILAIGRLLSTKLNDLLEWQKVHDSLGFYLEKNHHLTGIYGSLIRNYYNLPSYLKPCFLYFGLFPKHYPDDSNKGYLVDRMRLIRLWIAEGFITKGRDNLTLEEVAEEYLNELINKSLVEVGCRDFTGRPRTLRIHEFLHEIILSKVYELNFCQILSGKYCIVDEKPRRLSIHKDCRVDDARDFLKSITKGKSSIRCLLTFDPTHDILTKVITTTFLKNLHLLKVLDLCNAPVSEVPWAMGKLRNLRYLSLRNTRVNSLPSSIGKLQDLQTLDLKQTFIRELPLDIKGLSRLRHLLTYRYESDYDFNPHIQRVTGVNIAQGALGNFGELQKLAFVDLGNGIRLTKELRNLRRLGIMGLKLNDGKETCPAIEEMKYLQALNVYSKNKSEMIDLEHFQSSPPQTLKHLYLNGPLRSFPRWILDLHNLVKIRLGWSSLHDSGTLENLSTLPNLLELILLEAYNGQFLEITNRGFKKLKILCLLDLHGLECLLINAGALSLLEELSIGESPKLQVPSGIQYLRKLKTLNFFNMPQQFTDYIQPGEHYYSTVQHVPHVFFRKCVQGIWETYTLR